jgi:DNA repair exonuclease SbcCD ATPase subunit
MTNGDDNVIRLEGTEWYSAEELANRLDVSVRTIYRRLERGGVEKRETPRGTVYRTSSDKQPDSPKVPPADRKADSRFGEAVLRLVENNNEQAAKIAELTGQVARLEAQLEAALEDKKRLLEYVQEADSRLDDVVDELEQTEAELMQSRAKTYLEAGRREMADERLEDARERADRLEEANRRLEKHLEDADQRKRRWSPFGK